MSTDLDEFEADLRIALIEAEVRATPSPDLERRILTANHTDRRHRAVNRWIAPALAAAAVIAIAAAVFATGPGGGTNGHPRPGSHSSPVSTPPVSMPPTTPPSIPSSQFRAAGFSFPTGNDLWVIGSRRCGGGGCAALLHSADGGRTWSNVALPAGLTDPTAGGDGSCNWNSPSGPCVDHVTFAPDGRDGYIWSVGAMYWTADAGRTWHQSARGATAVVIAGQSVLRLEPFEPCGGNRCKGALVESALGSGDWTSVPVIADMLDVSASSLGAQESTAVLVAMPMSHSGATTWQSTNEGRTWREVTSPCAKPVSAQVGVDGTVLLNCTHLGRLESYRSLDGGYTFGPPIPEPVAAGCASILAPSRTSLVCVSERYLFAGDRFQTTVYVSLNPRRSWLLTARQSASSGQGGPSGVIEHASVAADGRVYVPRPDLHSAWVSSDGGVSWHVIMLG